MLLFLSCRYSSSLILVTLLQTKISPSASTTAPDDQDGSSPATEALLSQPEGLPTQETPMN